MADQYGDFVNAFVANAHSAFDVDADVNSSKRPKLKHDDLVVERKAVSTRFMLGSNDNAYMQCGLTILNVSSEGQKKELAPSSLYSASALNGLKAGLFAAQLNENEAERQKSPSELVFVANHVIQTFFSVDEVVSYLQSAEPSLTASMFSNTITPEELSKHPQFVLVLRLLLFIVTKDDTIDTQQYLAKDVFDHLDGLRNESSRVGLLQAEQAARRKFTEPDTMPDWLSAAEDDVARAQLSESNAKRDAERAVKRAEDAERSEAASAQAAVDSDQAAVDSAQAASEAVQAAAAANTIANGTAAERDKAVQDAAEANIKATNAVREMTDAVLLRIVAEAKAAEATLERDEANTRAKGDATARDEANTRAEDIATEALKLKRQSEEASEEATESAKKREKEARDAASEFKQANKRLENRYRDDLGTKENEIEQLRASITRQQQGGIPNNPDDLQKIQGLELEIIELKTLSEALERAVEQFAKQNERLEAELRTLNIQLQRSPAQTQAILHMHRRGIFGHRAPHEAASNDPRSTDGLISYKTAANAAITFRVCSKLRDVKLPEESTTQVSFDDRTHMEAMDYMGGDFAIDETTTAEEESRHPQPSLVYLSSPRQIRWIPNGHLAPEVCEAALLEHATAKLSQVASTPMSSLSQQAKTLMLATAARLKLEQMSSLHVISHALIEGREDELPQLGTHNTERHLVTRPVARIGCGMLFAHDSHKEHAAPIDTSLLLTTADAWDLAAKRRNADYRGNTGSKTATFYCPPTKLLAFVPAPVPSIGAPPVTRPDSMINSNTGPTAASYTKSALLKLIRYGLYYATLPSKETLVNQHKELLEYTNGTADGSAESRRQGLWNEFHREIAISTDRLFVFVKTLSGLIGDDVDSLISPADESTIRAAKELRDQRKAVTDRVTAFQTKLVEMLVSGVLKESKLQLATLNPGSTPVVVDADVRKQINDLASGESGRPFFEANVALRQMVDRSQNKGTSLAEFVGSVTTIVDGIHQKLEADAVHNDSIGATLAELSAPRNSYFIRLKDDVSAAIRESHDRFTVESRLRGISRKLSLWELVEGNDHVLSSRFAAFVGHVLVQNRTSTGVSALYVGRLTREVNSSHALVSLQRLCNHALSHASAVRAPDFLSPTNRLPYFDQHTQDTIVAFGGAGYTGGFDQSGWVRGIVY